MPEAFVDAAYLQKAAEELRHLKNYTYECMEIHSGDHVIDLGCGPGVDTIPLAKHVGASGRVTGIDIDKEMIRQANAYAVRERVNNIVTHKLDDVTSLVNMVVLTGKKP